MEAALARSIVEVGTDSGMEFQLREEYGGRGMYGAKTAAVICESFGEFTACLVEVVRGLLDEEDADSKMEAIACEVRHLRTDSMGVRVIFY